MKNKRVPHPGEFTGTVLFLDIRNFLGVTETLTPRETHHFICKVMEPLTEQVRAHGGYVCQVQGDAVMAVFGGMDSNAAHAEQAVNCAVEQQRTVGELDPVAVNGYRLPLSARTGISSGALYACENRFSGESTLTVIGRQVNIASRLQEINKRYGTKILIDASVFPYINSSIVTRKLDRVNIEGCSGTRDIHEVLGRQDKNGTHARRKKFYEEGLGHYERGELDKAIACFSRIGEDRPSYIMIERCKKEKAAGMA